MTGEVAGELVGAKSAVVVDTYIPLMDMHLSVDPCLRIPLATLRVFKWSLESSDGNSNNHNTQQPRHASIVLEGILVSYLYNPLLSGGLAGKTLQMHHFLPALEAIGRQLHDLSFLVTSRRTADTNHTSDSILTPFQQHSDTILTSFERAGADSRGSLGSNSDSGSGDESEAPELDARPKEASDDDGHEGDLELSNTAPLHMAITYRLMRMFESIDW
jgi:hypothetical protein